MKNITISLINKYTHKSAIKLSNLLNDQTSPKILINSFWRSGSTFLLEFTANLFELKPQFEPINPREEKFSFLYNRGCNENGTPVLLKSEIEQFNQIIDHSNYHSYWVNRNLNLSRVIKNRGKVIKVVNGAHVLSKISNKDIVIVHLEREIEGVVSSFLNSGWTKSFFNNLILNDLTSSEDPQIANFYLKHAKYLETEKMGAIEKITVYHSLINKFIKTNLEDINVFKYEEFLKTPEVYCDFISRKTGLSYVEEKVPTLLKVKSQTTKNPKNRYILSESDLKKIRSLQEEILSI